MRRFMTGFVLLLCVFAHKDPFAGENNDARPSAVMLSLPCAGCHGTGGRSIDAAPSIRGLDPASFVQKMRAFKNGERQASIMNRIAKGYQDQDFAAMAHYFAKPSSGAKP